MKKLNDNNTAGKTPAQKKERYVPVKDRIKYIENTPQSDVQHLVGDWHSRIESNGLITLIRQRFTGRGRKPTNTTPIEIKTLATNKEEALQWLPKKRSRKYLTNKGRTQIPIILP